MKRKGFTLIELLAVIVILAIIAVIATPMVLNTIDDAKKGAASSSARTYMSAVETSLTSYMLRNNGSSYAEGKYTIDKLKTDLGVEVKGDAPSEGNVCIASNGTVSKASVKINGYVINYDGKEAKTTDLDAVEDITCDEVISYQAYYTGTKDVVSTIYYNPVDNVKCIETEAVSANGTKTGCMKWYAIENSDSTKETVDVILAHSTTTSAVWNYASSNVAGIEEAEKILMNDTDQWVDELNPRLITVNEVAQITGNITFDLSTATSDDWFWFDSNDQNRTVTTQGESNYSWLFDYTYSCTEYGCNTDNGSSYMNGYTTSNIVNSTSDFIWLVAQGRINAFPSSASTVGVRPVITISKDVIK